MAAAITDRSRAWSVDRAASARAQAPELLHPPVPVVEQRALTEERRRRAPMDPPGGVVELTCGKRGTRPRRAHPLAGRRVEVLDEHAHLFDEDLRAHGGVLHEVCATSSATLRSTSWPTPVRTGTGMPAISRATCSVSNGTRDRRANRRRGRARPRRACEAGASSPERPHDAPRAPPRPGPARRPRRSATRSRSPRARARSRGRRRCPGLVIRPTRSGTGASTSRALRSSRPSAASARSTRSRSAAIPPDGEHRIDRAHDQLELARVHADPAADAHLDVVAELGARAPRRGRGLGRPVVAEQRDVDRGRGPVAAAGGLLDQGK